MRRVTGLFQSWFPITLVWLVAITIAAAIVAALLGPAD
jgi:hypothetical protein